MLTVAVVLYVCRNSTNDNEKTLPDSRQGLKSQSISFIITIHYICSNTENDGKTDDSQSLLAIRRA